MSSSPFPPMPSATLDLGDDTVPPGEARDFGNQFGLLAREKIELMLRRKMIRHLAEIEPAQVSSSIVSPSRILHPCAHEHLGFHMSSEVPLSYIAVGVGLGQRNEWFVTICYR